MDKLLQFIRSGVCLRSPLKRPNNHEQHPLLPKTQDIHVYRQKTQDLNHCPKKAGYLTLVSTLLNSDGCPDLTLSGRCLVRMR